MPEPTFSMTAEDDDLPRTIRRERDAREREARERQAREVESPVSMPSIDHDAAYGALASPPATVTAIDVPFLGLMTFFIKAVFAAVPALIMLTALLWLFGQGLQSFFPQLLKMKIDVQIYAPQSAADFRGERPPPRR
jgi:hypothetical protein